MIKEIYIKNFRSIKELSFEPKKLNAIVGANSAGKTNILKALDLIIGEGWTTKAKVAKELFNDTARPILIEVKFDTPINIPYGQPGATLEVYGLRLKMTLNPLACTTFLINGNDEEKFMSDEFKKKCHFIYIPSQRDLRDELRVSQWTMLGKMMKMVYENYVSFKGNEDTLKEEFEEAIQPAKDFLQHDFSATTQKASFTTFSESFIKHCEKNSAGLAKTFEPHLNIYNLNWFYKTLQISVHENEGLHFDAEDVGAGVQNLILLSIFQTYAELNKGNVIFGIEEPELYLYPHAQRELYSNFINLSGQSQIFYTTHNPNFIDAYRAYEIFMVKYNATDGTSMLEKNEGVVNPQVFQTQRFKIYTHFSPERNELFFANYTILVEGDSDKIFWSTLLEDKWGIDLNKKGISIIECGGKGGVIYFTGVMRLMGIDCFHAIWDRDTASDGDAQGQLPYAIANGKGLELDPNLERFLASHNITVRTGTQGSKVDKAYAMAISLTPETIPTELNVIKDLFITPAPASTPVTVAEDDDEF